ncbi:MAG: hydrogenase formation protein HypD [Bryobacterales bacterium]|nr:hydrogenase formation protein HypD [Bryobacterales bacterium]
MKHLDEYRDAPTVAGLAQAIHRITTQSWTLMEICGGQTHNILRNGLDRMLPPGITLVHGPGCPVCVTPVELIDKAVAIAGKPEVIFCSFGDMIRVPGSQRSLLDAKAMGADLRVVYSPLDAVNLARQNPARQVVFFAVGFETTAPANAMAVWQSQQLGVDNFSVLVAHVLVPPAMESILGSPNCRVQGFLAPGHVCTVEGYLDYEPVAAYYRVPVVVTGFEPVDILEGILMVVQQLESGRAEVENQYARVVHREGNTAARDLVRSVFEVSDRSWRGVGRIPNSGLKLRERYRSFDAEARFGIRMASLPEPDECIAGLVLQGVKKPCDCPAFGTSCTPERPLGAPMVSSEGACSAYYLYARS